ncbi:MAG: DUF4373 domain-containing protein [Eggerthellaceae bacterium]|nr:DUF4373 domain-containing protein [Eggerthellaceae bacterium]
MAQVWLRLDTDFYHDPKVERLEAVTNGQGVFRWIKLCCIAHEGYGQIDTNDAAMLAHAERHTGLKGRRFSEFVDACAACGLFDPEQWGKGVITSNRMLLEGSRRLSSEQQKAEAGRRSAEARKRKKEDSGK